MIADQLALSRTHLFKEIEISNYFL